MYTYERIHVSGRRFDTYGKFLNLDSNSLTDGMKVVDVGSGFSDFTERCLERGVAALAVDVGYSNLDRMITDYLTQSLPETLEGMRDKFRNRLDDCSTYQEGRERIIQLRRSRIEGFLQWFNVHRQHYLADNCFALPFDRDSLDLAVSVELLGHPAYFQAADSIRGIQEMTRVAREVRIYSFLLDGNLTENMKGLEDSLGGRTVAKPNEHLLIITTS